MSDKAERRFLVGDGFAVSCEVDDATNSFDFVLDSGGRKVVRFPEATPEEVAKAIADIRSCDVPVTCKGKQ